MTTKITESGLTLSKEWFPDVDEVEIHKERDRVVIRPTRARDAILDWGQNAVTTSETDASENHDLYLYP